MPSMVGQRRATVEEESTGHGAQIAELGTRTQRFGVFVKERSLAGYMRRIVYLEILACSHQNTWKLNTDVRDRLKQRVHLTSQYHYSFILSRISSRSQ